MDLDTGELSNNGRRFTLSDKPFQVLVALLEKPGQLVSREELKKRLWGSETFVDFDLGLNKAVNRLRETLNDSAERPCFIETLPRRGYRFIASVAPEDTSVVADKMTHDQGPQGMAANRRRQVISRLLVFAVVFLALVASGTVWKITKVPIRGELRLKQLTWNSDELPVRSAAISPDGNYLAFSDRNGIHITVLATNESRTVPSPISTPRRVDWWIIGWFPDSTRFVAQTAPGEEICLECVQFSTWIVSVLGGEPRKIHDGVNAESISPDGKSIAFTAVLGEPGGREIGVMDASGDHARTLFATDTKSWMRYVRWSPDGLRLAYMLVHDDAAKTWSLESRDMQGGAPVLILPNANDVQHDFIWLANGEVMYGTNEPVGNGCNYWKLKVNPRSGTPESQAQKITNWAGFCVDSTSVTADGKRLAFTESIDQASIYVAPLQQKGARITEPKRLSVIEGLNWPTGWAADNKSLVFLSSRERTSGFYRQALDSDVAEPILLDLSSISRSSQVTPDGQWVLYVTSSDEDSVESRQLMRVRTSGGGRPELVLSGELRGVRCAKLPADLCVVAGWSTDRSQVVFYALDVISGRGRELFRSDSSAVGHFGWELSPDGTKLLLIHIGGKETLEIASLLDRYIRPVPLQGWNISGNITWTSDSNGLFVGSPTQRGCVLLHVDLKGKASVVWEQRGALATIGLPSPDGRQLALTRWSLSSNAWVIENF